MYTKNLINLFYCLKYLYSILTISKPRTESEQSSQQGLISSSYPFNCTKYFRDDVMLVLEMKNASSNLVRMILKLHSSQYLQFPVTLNSKSIFQFFQSMDLLFFFLRLACSIICLYIYLNKSMFSINILFLVLCISVLYFILNL